MRGSPGASSLWGRRARTARPRITGCHLGHPPALWIAGMYRHRGSGASRRVPYGGAYPGLSRRAWTARDSESAGQPSPSAYRAALPLRSAHHPSWAGTGPARASAAVRPQRSTRPAPTATGPGPVPDLVQVGVLTGPGPSTTSPQVGALTGSVPSTSGRTRIAGPGRPGSATTSDSGHSRGLDRRAVINQGGRVTLHAARQSEPCIITGRAGYIRDSENPVFPSDQNKPQRLAACAPNALSFQPCSLRTLLTPLTPPTLFCSLH